MHRRGDVVLVPIDFTDRTGSKWRPAVVVSVDEYQLLSPDVVIASVTSNLRAIPHPGDHQIVNWRSAGLLRPSLLQMKFATVDASLVGRSLGRLSTADLDALDRSLRRALDIG